MSCRAPRSHEGSVKLTPILTSSIMGPISAMHGAGEMGVLGVVAQGLRSTFSSA